MCSMTVHLANCPVGGNFACTCGATDKLEPVDRAEILIQRAVNCGWITVHDRDQLKRNMRVGLDQEVRSGGPYIERLQANTGVKSC